MAINIAQHLLSSALVSNTTDIANTLKDALTIKSSETSPTITEFGDTEKNIFKKFVHDEHKHYVEDRRFDRVLSKILGEQNKSLKQIANYLSPTQQRKQFDYLASQLGNFGTNGTVDSPVSPIFDMLSFIPDLFGGDDKNKKPRPGTRPGQKPKGFFKKLLGKGSGKFAALFGLGSLIADGAASSYTPDIINQNDIDGSSNSLTEEEKAANKRTADIDEESKARKASKPSSLPDADFKEAQPSSTTRETISEKVTNNNTHSATSSSTTTKTSVETNNFERERVNTVNERLRTNIPEAKPIGNASTAVISEVAEDATKSGWSAVGKGFSKFFGVAATVLTAVPDVMDTIDVVNDEAATKEEKAEAVGGTTGKIAGGVAGGVAGGNIGAWVGGGIGALFGGVGAVPGALIGGFIGSAVGSWLGSEGGEEVGKDIGLAVAEQLPEDEEDNSATSESAPIPEAVPTEPTDSEVINTSDGKQVSDSAQVQIQPPTPIVTETAPAPAPETLPPPPLGLVNTIQPLARAETIADSSSNAALSVASQEPILAINPLYGAQQQQGSGAVSATTSELVPSTDEAVNAAPVLATATAPITAPQTSDTDSTQSDNTSSSLTSMFSSVLNMASLPIMLGSTVSNIISKYNPLNLGKQDDAAAVTTSTSSVENINNQYKDSSVSGDSTTNESPVLNSLVTTLSAVIPGAGLLAGPAGLLADSADLLDGTAELLNGPAAGLLAGPVGLLAGPTAGLLAGPAAELFEGQFSPIINTVKDVLSFGSDLGSRTANALFSTSDEANPNIGSEFNTQYLGGSSSQSANNNSFISNSSSAGLIHAALGISPSDDALSHSASAYAPPVMSDEFNRERYVEPASSTDMVQLDKTMKETLIIKEQSAAPASPNVSTMQRDVSINLNNTPMVTNDLGLLIINSGVV